MLSGDKRGRSNDGQMAHNVKRQAVDSMAEQVARAKAMLEQRKRAAAQQPTPAQPQSHTPPQVQSAGASVPLKLGKLIGIKLMNGKQPVKCTLPSAFGAASDDIPDNTTPNGNGMLRLPSDVKSPERQTEQPVTVKSEPADIAHTNGNGHTAPPPTNTNADIDPLDAFMSGLQGGDVVKQQSFYSTSTEYDTDMNGNDHSAKVIGIKHETGTRTTLDSIDNERYFNDDDAALSEDELDHIDDGIDRSDTKYKDAVKRAKGINIERVDHSKQQYEPVRKNFYIEHQAIRDMTDDEVAMYRLNELENVRIRGKDCIRPVKTWLQCGLSEPVYNILHNIDKFEAPFPIQAQAIPVLMSGRDCIACAKTGSGKSLAFTLPLIRHVADQRPLQQGDGPIALVLAPTRELCAQLYHEIRKYSKPHGLKTVAVFGGTGIGQQINIIKAGCHVLVATPGRLIDILNTNSGKLIDMARMTYVVLDEADRMFDLGFAPQIEMIVMNIRPDRQTVMFSATFPRIVEQVARKILSNPIEIVIGGRSIVSDKITQKVELLDDRQQKLRRLLQLLGDWYNKGQILIFVDRQDTVDTLYQQLLENGYNAVTVHGAMDQIDRDNAIIEFKDETRSLCIATSVIARGLDVKNLILVVNYECPKHIEDYIHRVGRTGRGGKQGTAITFVLRDEAKLAAQLVVVLQASKQPVPDDVMALSQTLKKAVKKQLMLTSGYSGRGFKFDATESSQRTESTKQKQQLLLESADQRQDAAGADGIADDEAVSKPAEVDAGLNALEQMKKEIESSQSAASAQSNEVMRPDGSFEIVKPAAEKPAAPAKPAVDSIAQQIAAARKAAEAAKDLKGNTIAAAFAIKAAMITNAQPAAAPGVKVYSANHHHSKKRSVSAELVINDFNQTVRWKLVSKGGTDSICEQYGVSITVKGSFVPPGKQPPPGERPLYMAIEGPDEASVASAKRELVREVESAHTLAANQPQTAGRAGRYNVLGPASRETNLRLQ